ASSCGPHACGLIDQFGRCACPQRRSISRLGAGPAALHTRANIDRVDDATASERSALTALSPLDGRYAGKVSALRGAFSEFALIRHRVQIELAWLSALATEPAIEEVPPFSDAARAALAEAAERF